VGVLGGLVSLGLLKKTKLFDYIFNCVSRIGRVGVIAAISDAMNRKIYYPGIDKGGVDVVLHVGRLRSLVGSKVQAPLATLGGPGAPIPELHMPFVSVYTFLFETIAPETSSFFGS
jgi:hypothetical protein